MELDVGLWLGRLAKTVDPDRVEPARGGRREVVEQARPDVHVSLAVGTAPGEELVPVPGRRLVRADLGGDDREVDRYGNPCERGVEQVAVGVREDGELPAARTRVLECRRHLRERIPLRQRATERVLLGRGSAEPRERDGQDIPVAPGLVLPLDLRLELVVRMEELPGSRRA